MKTCYNVHKEHAILKQFHLQVKFYHTNISDSTVSLISGSMLEKKFKSPYFAYLLVVFTFLSSGVLVGLNWLMAQFYDDYSYNLTCAVGFSGKLFCLATLCKETYIKCLCCRLHVCIYFFSKTLPVKNCNSLVMYLESHEPSIMF